MVGSYAFVVPSTWENCVKVKLTLVLITHARMKVSAIQSYFMILPHMFATAPIYLLDQTVKLTIIAFQIPVRMEEHV